MALHHVQLAVRVVPHEAQLAGAAPPRAEDLEHAAALVRLLPRGVLPLVHLQGDQAPVPLQGEVQQRVAAVAGAVGEVHAELPLEGQLLSAQQPLHQGLPAAAVDGGVGAEVRRLVEALAAKAAAVRAHVLVREAHVLLQPPREAEALLAVGALVVPAALVHGGDVLPEPGRPGDVLPAVRALHGSSRGCIGVGGSLGFRVRG